MQNIPSSTNRLSHDVIQYMCEQTIKHMPVPVEIITLYSAPIDLAAANKAKDVFVELVTVFENNNARIELSDLIFRDVCDAIGIFDMSYSPRFVGPFVGAILAGFVGVAQVYANRMIHLPDTEESLDDPYDPLKLAALCAMPSVVKILLDRGYKSRDSIHYDGATPLHFAASTKKDNSEIIQMLLDSGADVNHHTVNHRTVNHHTPCAETAFQWALKKGLMTTHCL
ncbi:uncharacterized protein F4822DRAFT_443788 [Hypoxylon trugodes]|uniref:uncharacterized protein n=1 Tax=Hypoxylon trugodes TaxID=326681 RepID=UPI00218FD636|nr:uncharacterized protein F4822DRAFT_443788 [Hypoxylon trugodes]KAI1389067.1 hypothetical protein F4822DRAFT_443788 [Hypoxylon trugodes]